MDDGSPSQVAMPEKHHYIPVFYLKRWADTGGDGRLCIYSRWHARVEARRKHPSATGYGLDLYAVRGADAATEGHLEGRFFSAADFDASRALDIIESGPDAQLDDRLRSGWSRFVMTLLHRNPEAMAKWSVKAAEIAAEAERRFRENYATLRLPTDPETYEEYQRKPHGHYHAVTAVLLLQALMDHKDLGDLLNRMAWVVAPLQSSRSLLTSDRPLVMTNGLSLPGAHLAMPIGPRRLFVAANELALAQQIVRQGHDELVSMMNDLVVRQARKFVWGFDNSHLQFVEQRLGEMRPGSIIDLDE
jgi:hypothetical protein